nr:patatin-like phospholipase family protein [uncultured Halomonas sp.]
MPKSTAAECNILVLQGGGALGAYQAGAYQQLANHGYEPQWVAGISIGAINAAIICGNPPEHRVARLQAFWKGLTSGLTLMPWFSGAKSRQAFNEVAAAWVTVWGVPGFFAPKFPFMNYLADGGIQSLSFYDTQPLYKTLESLIDFDYLNSKGPRLSVGAVDIETGNFAYFDSEKQRITSEHVMASGALPPGFPPITIERHAYWDGGLVSNTPLQYVLDTASGDPVCIFQVDLFNARGNLPQNMAEVTQREKDIRYSSRTRLTTDRYVQLHDIRTAAERLFAKLPDELKNDPDMTLLRNTGLGCPVTLVHLIHRKVEYEGQSRDYEFSRLSMREHWASGQVDVDKTLAHDAWKQRVVAHDGLQVFDLGMQE